MMKIELAMDEQTAKNLGNILREPGHTAWVEIADAIDVVLAGKYDSSGDYELNGFQVSTP